MNKQNLNTVNLFLTDDSAHNLFINSNKSIDFFYKYIIGYYAQKKNISIKETETINENILDQDLFNDSPIWIYSGLNLKSIERLIKINKKKIIFTEYKNFKLFNKDHHTLNSYNFKFDLDFFLNEELKINNKLLFNFIHNFPEHVFSEVSKYLLNENGYSIPLQNLADDKIINLRKTMYNIKKDEKINLINLFSLLKDEAKFKKFSFLIS